MQQTNKHQHIYPSLQCNWLQEVTLLIYVLFYIIHLPLDFTPYINVLITFSSGIFKSSLSSFCQLYLWKHQRCSRGWAVLYIFLRPVGKPVDHRITISTNLFILFFPFAKMPLRLVPEAVAWDSSNTKRCGVLIKLPFQTALQGMKFWTIFFASIYCCSRVRFLTNSTCPRLCNLASDCITFSLSCGS